MHSPPSVVLELAFDLAGRQTSAVLREINPAAVALDGLHTNWLQCRVCLRRSRRRSTNAAKSSPTINRMMRHIFNKPTLEKLETAGDGASSQSGSETLADLLEQCTNVPPILVDGVTPQHICRHCEHNLYAAVRFKRLCERSDARFRSPDWQRLSHVDDDDNNGSSSEARIKRDTTEYLESDRVGTPTTTTTAAAASVVVVAKTESAEEPADEEYDGNGSGGDGAESDSDVDVTGKPTTSGRVLRERNHQPGVADADRLPSNSTSAADTKKRGLPARLRKFKCQQCGSRFAKKHTLTVHERTHSGDRPYACDICQARFRTLSAVSSHLTRHTGVRNFACKQCAYRTSTRQNLRLHERTHDAGKAYGCQHCGARFKTNSNMRKHERNVHGAKREWRCGVCQQCFVEAETLRKHMVRHDGRRPYACPGCERTYGWFTGLQRHMMKYHAELKVPTEKTLRANATTTTTTTTKTGCDGAHGGAGWQKVEVMESMEEEHLEEEVGSLNMIL